MPQQNRAQEKKFIFASYPLPQFKIAPPKKVAGAVDFRTEGCYKHSPTVGTIAQSVEHEPFKLGVVGSSPTRLTTNHFAHGRFPFPFSPVRFFLPRNSLSSAQGQSGSCARGCTWSSRTTPTGPCSRRRPSRSRRGPGRVAKRPRRPSRAGAIRRRKSAAAATRPGRPDPPPRVFILPMFGKFPAFLPMFGKRRRKRAEREGFEPPMPCGIPVFKTGAFDRSAISPTRANLRISRRFFKPARGGFPRAAPPCGGGPPVCRRRPTSPPAAPARTASRRAATKSRPRA